jgi:hypothetical protein
MKYILYTTSKSKRVQEQADIFAKEISKTKGRGEVTIKVVHKIPTKPQMELRNDGYYMPIWSWFRSNYNRDGYDVAIAHFSPIYRTKWGIKSPTGNLIGGSRNPNSKEYPEYWVCDDLSLKAADGYPEWVNDFLRKLFHEQAHCDEDLDDNVGNILTQASVHDMDYKLKKIHLYHYLVDYRGKALKEKVNSIVNKVIKLAKQYI